MREVTRFWEADLRYGRSIRYVVVDDAREEDSDHRCINSCSGIALVRMTMRLILDMSAELGFRRGIVTRNGVTCRKPSVPFP